jgi:putative Mn2+ efflux pump MntP
MSIWQLIILAVGLSMDAFAVAVCKGLSVQKLHFRNAVIVGLYFGIFQAGMPLIGYFLGSTFSNLISQFDHWIAFILLGLIGGNMIRESFQKEEGCETCNAAFRVRDMLVLAVATSIDALAVGVTFAFLNVNIVPAVSIIGVITFTLSMLGVKIGHVFGNKYKAHAELFGGVVLILIGLNILLEHLGFLGT